MYSKSNRWTPEQDAQLIALRAKGFGYEAIALAVGHTPAACATRGTVLRAGEPKPRQAFHRESYAAPAAETKQRGQKRPCLRCENTFWSAGAGNRLCSNCRQISMSPLAMPARVLR